MYVAFAKFDVYNSGYLRYNRAIFHRLFQFRLDTFPSVYVSKEVLFSNPSILVPELWAIAEHAEPLFCEVYRIEIRCITLLSLTYLQSVAKLDPSQAKDNTRVTGFPSNRC